MAIQHEAKCWITCWNWTDRYWPKAPLIRHKTRRKRKIMKCETTLWIVRVCDLILFGQRMSDTSHTTFPSNWLMAQVFGLNPTFLHLRICGSPEGQMVHKTFEYMINDISSSFSSGYDQPTCWETSAPTHNIAHKRGNITPQEKKEHENIRGSASVPTPWERERE